MRRYQMRQKLFSLRDQFRIRDAEGTSIYVVKGRLISIRDRLSFEDTNGQQLLDIRQKLVSWRPQYRLYSQGRLCAIVQKRLLSVLGSRFVISIKGEPNLLAKGNFLDYEYRFLRGRQQVAQVSKRWFTLADSYGVQVDEESVGGLLILACAVIIDMINHNPKREDVKDESPEDES
jgi:uncharacterized protein YxjI